jgi:large subunit ribosomal protein L35
MKTKRTMAKRMKLTGRGKVLVRQRGRNHLLAKKSRNRKRALRAPTELKGQDARNVKRMVLH